MRNFEFIHIINYIIEKEIHMTDMQTLIGLNIQQSKEKSIKSKTNPICREYKKNKQYEH